MNFHRFHADPHPDATFYCDDDPDLAPTPKFYTSLKIIFFFILFTALPVYTLIFLVIVKGVIVFNFLDSKLKLSGKKYM